MSEKLKKIYEQKIGNATYRQLSEFIKSEIGTGLKPIWDEIEKIKRVDDEANSNESVEEFLLSWEGITSSEAKSLLELTLLHVKVGFSLTKAFSEAKMFLMRLNSKSQI